MIEVILCMGSSCYSRGNSRALTLLEAAMEREAWQAKVFLKGCVCGGHCSEGPVVTVEGQVYSSVHPDSLIDIVRHHLEGASE